MKIVRGQPKPLDKWYQINMVIDQPLPLDILMKELLKKRRLQSSSLDHFSMTHLSFQLKKEGISMMIVKLNFLTTKTTTTKF